VEGEEELIEKKESPTAAQFPGEAQEMSLSP
jgi:hypothetical protein